MNMNELPDLLTVQQYAELMQFNYKTVTKMLSNKTIKAFGVGREWRIEKEDGKGFDNLREISTMPQLTKHLQTSRTTILRAIKANELKGERIGRDWRFKKQNVLEWVKRQNET